jgi:hypothetical protein
MKELQALPGTDIDSNHNLLFSKVCTRLRKITGFQKGRPIMAWQKSHDRRKGVQDTVGEKLDAIDCENRNIKEQWNIFKKCSLDGACDVVEKVRGEQRRLGLHRK